MSISAPLFRFGFLSGVFLSSTLMFLTSCATTPSPSIGGPEGDVLPRTELVLLNIPEGSGWVAYRPDSMSEDVEDYRIVVLRQADNSLIYDSVIPLAANMATHGFELAKDDPRLRELGFNVDKNIIEPLESVAETEMFQEETEDAPPSEELESAERIESVPEPKAEAPEQEAELRPMTTDGLVILKVEGNIITIGISEKEEVTIGDTLFVRTPDKTIALPGTGEELLVSSGAVAGMVEVISVDGKTAQATLLNGTIPDRAKLERDQE